MLQYLSDFERAIRSNVWLTAAEVEGDALHSSHVFPEGVVQLHAKEECDYDFGVVVATEAKLFNANNEPIVLQEDTLAILGGYGASCYSYFRYDRDIAAEPQEISGFRMFHTETSLLSAQVAVETLLADCRALLLYVRSGESIFNKAPLCYCMPSQGSG